MTLYHTRELDKEQRSHFSLGCSPYLILTRPNDAYVKKTIDHLRELSVIMYRDNASASGSGIFLIEGQELPTQLVQQLKNTSDLSDYIGRLQFKEPVSMFRSSCICNVNSSGRISIAQVIARTESEQIGRLRRIRTKGDDFHWIYWNSPVLVTHINHAVVNTVKA